MVESAQVAWTVEEGLGAPQSLSCTAEVTMVTMQIAHMGN